MPLTPGSRLGPYEVLSPFGVGGMGEVYRARDTKPNRDVAIKVLLAAVANDPDGSGGGDAIVSHLAGSKCPSGH